MIVIRYINSVININIEKWDTDLLLSLRMMILYLPNTRDSNVGCGGGGEKEKKRLRVNKRVEYTKYTILKPFSLYQHQSPKNRKRVNIILKIAIRIIKPNQHTKKSVAFLYTNKEQSEKKIKKAISFTIEPKRIKYLAINFNQGRKKSVRGQL